MSDYPVMRGSRSGDPHPRLRLAALTAVIAGVILVAVAAFLLSYAGIHQIALQAGVSPRLARLYPLMFDAMLVITGSAVLATRTAGWGTKTYVWVCLLLVVGAVALGDALHATGVHLTGQAARATIAVVPWVLLLLGFGIWLVMLRHWRRMRVTEAVNQAEAERADRAAQADRNGHAGRAAPAAQAGPPDRAPQAAPAGPPDRAAQAMAASAAAGGAVSWAAGRGTTPARTRAPRMGIDSLLEQQAGRAPERPPAVDGPAANRATATGQGKQRTAPPGEHQPAGTTAAAAAGTAAGIAAGMAAGTKPATRGDTGPGTPEESRPETTAATTPGTTAGTPGTAAGTTPGAAAATATTAAATAAGTTATAAGTTAGTTSGTADTGAGADARAGAIGSADPASTGPDSGGKDKAGALGGLLEVPVSEDDEEGSVRILPEQPKAPATEAASSQDGGEAGGTGDGKETPASALTEGSKTFESMPAGTADPDPANPPAPLPHFDRLRSTPTPPQETGADGE